MKNQTVIKTAVRALQALGLLGLMTAALPGYGQVLPPSSNPYGKSYADWSAAWWQWALGQSTNDMPNVSGPISGPVEFLAGAPASETATRQITIPAGTALFFPVLSVWSDNSGCPAFTTNTVAQLQAETDGLWSEVSVTACTIDGVAVPGLENPQTNDYFTTSTPFSYTTAPTNNVLEGIYGEPCIPGGLTIGPAVADGVYLMLAPLAPGIHTINLVGIVGPTNAPFLDTDLTYEITVLTASGIYPTNTTPYGKSYADWAAAWWQWSLGQSTDQMENISGPTSGPVEFLAGAPASETATRQVTIPAGTALFFSILSVWVDNSGCPAFTTNTVAQMQAEADGLWSEASVTVCTIDGVAVTGLENPQTNAYFTPATPFSYTTAPTNNVLAGIYGETCIPGGLTIGPAVADGVYLMLAPLAPGAHTINFVGIVGPTNAPYLDTDLTYDVTVLPAALGIAVQGGNVVLSWPQTPVTYSLESTSSLNPPDWLPLNAPVQSVGALFQVTIPMEATSRFFRLQSQ